MLAAESTTASDVPPLRAQLAFAARCARRVINLFRLPFNHPEFARSCRSLGAAIRLAESFAVGDEIDADELAQAEAGALRAVTASSEMQPPNERAAYAANAAYAALCAVKAAFDSESGSSPAERGEQVVQAVKIARDAAIAADDNVARSARLDWELLGQMPLGHFPDFGEPVDAGESGSLGPLFQDLSRGSPSTATDSAHRGKSSPSAAGSTGRHQSAELTAIPGTGARAQQLVEFEGLRKQIEADRRQVQVDRAAFDAEKQSLQMQLLKELANLDRERQKLHNDQQTIEGQFANSESLKSQFESRRADLETREHELAAHCGAVDSREQELQAREAELESREEEFGAQLAEIEMRAAQLEAEKNATRAAFESLEEERREFLEQRLRWTTTQPKP